MRTVLAFGFAALAATAAVADPAATGPEPVGISHACLEYYPPASLRLGEEGQTILRFYIAADGTVQDIVVVNSSGSSLLDQAAVDCARPWTYKPATLDGRPIAALWKTQVDWLLHDPFTAPEKEVTPPPGATWVPPEPLSDDDDGCEISFSRLTRDENAPKAIPPEGPSILRYTIGQDGTTRNVELTHSSGSTWHDDNALACVKRWRYRPATHDGKPVAERWVATIPWPDRASRTAHPPPGRIIVPEKLEADSSCDMDRNRLGANDLIGKTSVGFIITSKGLVGATWLRKSSGNAKLDEAALQCVSHWRYKPGTENEQPVSFNARADIGRDAY